MTYMAWTLFPDYWPYMKDEPWLTIRKVYRGHDIIMKLVKQIQVLTTVSKHTHLENDSKTLHIDWGNLNVATTFVKYQHAYTLNIVTHEHMSWRHHCQKYFNNTIEITLISKRKNCHSITFWNLFYCTRNRHPIARPKGWAMGWLFRVESVVYAFPSSVTYAYSGVPNSQARLTICAVTKRCRAFFYLLQ